MAYPGFDTGNFPGLPALEAWWGNSPFVWVGYYLPAPCHTSTFVPWIGNRAAIAAIGYGFAVVYVGRFQGGCGDADLSRDQGFTDGQQAAATTQSEGFPDGSTIFLDVEKYDPPIRQDMQDYVRGWLNAVQTASFNPGIYVHHTNLDEVNLAAETEYAALGLPGGHPKYWILYAGPAFDVATSAPTDCKIALANVWQGDINVTGQTYGGVAISVVDFNVADQSDPSAAFSI
jgi:hypothetical protein